MNANIEDLGRLLLRLGVGGLLLLHGIYKVQNGIAFVVESVTRGGLPAFFAYGVYVGEVVAPLLVITGFYARIGAWLIAVNMLFALGLVHTPQLFLVEAQSGGLDIEKQYMYLLSAIALALLGPGRHAFNDR